MEAVQYPIKYTFMPIIEDCTKKAYIVIKCYDIGKQDIKEINGRVKTVHRIVPFYNGDFIRQVPAHLSDGRCYNFTLTSIVFDELQDAIRYTRVLNQTQILHGPDYSFTKYYNIENNLLNDRDINDKSNSKIVDINDYRSRTRKRVIHGWKLFNRVQ